MVEEDASQDECQMTDPPRDIRIERETRDMYEDLQQDEPSPYEGARFLDIFLNAAAVGSYQGLRQPLDGETMSLFNESSLSNRHRAIIRSIAWKETQDKEIYYDQQQAFTIVMEFANGGIRQLHSARLGIGDNIGELMADYIALWQDTKPELEEQSLLEDE